MNKKIYIAPAMEIVEVEPVVMLAASNRDFDISNETTGDDAVMSNKRRGTWGDLWADDKE